MKICRVLCFTLLLTLLPALGLAEIDVSLREELKILERGERLPLRIPDAKFRVASFTYEDPDGTRLGDALALLVGRQILVQLRSSSIGLLNYEGGLAPTETDRLSYFDKVEKVAQAQQVTLSVWGMVRRSGSNLTIDTYVQLPPALIERTFVWRVKLPTSMGGELVAHLRPERIHAQRLQLPASAAEKFLAAASDLRTLRSEPTANARVVGTLPKGATYWVEKEQGEWLYFNAGSGRAGWVRRAGSCVDQCAPLLDAGNFAAALLSSTESPGARRIEGELSADARAIGDQLQAFELLDRSGEAQFRGIVAQIGERLRQTRQAGRVPAGGAALANAWTIGTLVEQLNAEAKSQAAAARSRDITRFYANLKPDRARIRALAFDLADASLADPGNVDALHNLAILFAYAGEERRAALAKSLAARPPR